MTQETKGPQTEPGPPATDGEPSGASSHWIDRRLDKVRRSIRVTIAVFRSARRVMRALGLAHNEPTLFDVPRIAYRLAWGLIFVVVLVLPTYSNESFFIFPVTLAFVVAWLVGISAYVYALMSSDLSVIRLSPDAWIAFVNDFKSVGFNVPSSSMTDASAQQAAQELERPLPGLLLDAVLRWTTLIAAEAILGAIASLLGLLIGPLLANVHIWFGWSPVSILYAICIPVSLSLTMYCIVPLIIARTLVGARLRIGSSPATGSADASGAPTAPEEPKRQRHVE